MIGRYEISMASRDHIPRMGNPQDAMDALDIDPESLQALIEAMAEAREPEEHAGSLASAYRAGMLDGFIVGVRAQCFEHVVMCENCGDGVPRIDPGNDPVPEDYDPAIHHFLCERCQIARQASMN